MIRYSNISLIWSYCTMGNLYLSQGYLHVFSIQWGENTSYERLASSGKKTWGWKNVQLPHPPKNNTKSLSWFHTHHLIYPFSEWQRCSLLFYKRFVQDSYKEDTHFLSALRSLHKKKKGKQVINPPLCNFPFYWRNLPTGASFFFHHFPFGRQGSKSQVTESPANGR
jgi:hypothetical protein